jgi:hypothetical protein
MAKDTLRRFVVAAAFAAAASSVAPAHASDLVPPKRYDVPYRGALVELQVSQAGVVAACNAIGFAVPRHTAGCSVRSERECLIIYISAPYKGDTPAQVRRHELAHCNGWPANHPR